MNVHQIINPILKKIRKNRMKNFSQLMGIKSSTKILDVGGSPLNWSLLPNQPEVTLINLGSIDTKSFPFVVADGCFLPFKDKSFDIVFSNSVIEHIPGIDNQKLFASEVMRVGKSYYVQTPNRNFFIEPHLFTPFIHWLPKKIQKRIAARFSVRAIIMRILNDHSEDYLEDVYLLNNREVSSFFPKSKLFFEKWIGMNKSIIAYSNLAIE